MIAVIAGGYLAVDWYLTDVPESKGREYREAVEPRVEKVEDAMRRVNASFLGYLSKSSVPAAKLRNKDAEGAARILLPLYDRRDRLVRAGERAVKRTRKLLREAEPALADVPTGFLLDGKSQLVTAEESSTLGAEYIKRARRFLSSYEQWLRSERQITDLLRKRQKLARKFTVESDREAYLASVDRQSDGLARIEAAARRQKPHRDSAAMHKLVRNGVQSELQYFEEVRAAHDTLDQGRFDAAVEKAKDARRQERRRYGALLTRLRTKSGLAQAGRSLNARIGELRRKLAGVAAISEAG